MYDTKLIYFFVIRFVSVGIILRQKRRCEYLRNEFWGSSAGESFAAGIFVAVADKASGKLLIDIALRHLSL